MPVLKLVQGICTLNPIAIVFLCCQNYFILSSSMDKTVRLWHISRRECLCCFQHIDFVTAIAFHPKVVDLFTVTATGHYTIPITHTSPFSGPFPGIPGWASTRKVKPIWILLTTQFFTGLPAAQPTASKHWRHPCQLPIYCKASDTWLSLILLLLNASCMA